MRAELNHQAQSRPITANSDPSSQSPPTSFTQAQAQAETPEGMQPTLRCQLEGCRRAKHRSLDTSSGTTAQQSGEGMRTVVLALEDRPHTQTQAFPDLG